MRIDLTQLTSSQISNDPNAKRIGKQDPPSLRYLTEGIERPLRLIPVRFNPS